tara:strand:- start:8472 stop:11114 length:2643 start_codon:yes stop_codon:yes gene_type:complete
MSAGTYTDKLYKLLENNRVKKVDGDEKTSHYSMGTPVGSFYLTGPKRDRFNRLVSRALSEGTTLHLLEKPRSQGPIIFDIDIKYHSDNNHRRYTYDHILKTVEVYNNVIEKYFNIDPEHAHCFITEKKYPNKTNDTIYKDGFHGEYPNIVASTEMKFIIHREVVEEFEKNDYYNNINPLNKYSDIFDELIIRDTNWFIYGCCKPQREPYLLTHVIGVDLEEYNFKKKFTKENLPSILSIRQFGSEDLSPYKDNINEAIVKENFSKLNVKKKKVHEVRKRSREYTEEDIEYAQKLVKLLSVDRADNYQSWMEVGWALYNIDDLLIDNFIEFSQISTKFKFGECEKRWDKMRNEGTRGVGLGSLVKWAENDNPEEFKKLRADAEENIIRRSISGTSGDVARSFFHINKGKFKCASIKNSAWYEFRNHRWQPIDSAKTIMLMLNDEYPQKYKKVADYYYYRSQQLEGEEKKLFEIKREAALKTAEKLTTVKFKKDVIEELKHRYHDEEFYNKLDENRYLICCKNGVYDFKNNLFREGYPDDYISLCTNIDYISYDKNDEKIKQIETFFSQVQPEEGMFNYILDYFASCLVGHSPDEFFHIWTGSGGNAKSVSIGLFQSIIGDYATTISITLLTKTRAASNAASPEMANCKGKRFVVFQEPENDDKIHVGHMKELTGNDKISARALFKEPIEFYPQFKTILTCNKLPFIPSNDGGTWRRLRVAPFSMKFVNNPKEPNERKKDRNLKDKMENWKEPLLFMLIERYINRVKIEGLREPDKVKEFTNDYQRQSDIYYEYLSEQLEITNNKKDAINLTTMYNDFKMWSKEAHTERRVPPRCEFKDNIEDKLGKMRNNRWKCVRFCLDKNNSDNSDSESEDEKNVILAK